MSPTRMSDRSIARPPRADRWEDDDEERGPVVKRLSREEAQALIARDPSISPWRVVGAQAGLGAVLALVAWLLFADKAIAASVLYGAATVVVPGALMARGMTSRLTSSSPAASAVGFMVWEMLKLAVAVAMLMLAPKIVPGLSWPALLVAMVVGIKVYWFALLWRGRKTTTSRRG